MLSVLFDLDDTLIDNNADLFTRVYIKLLGDHLQEKVDSRLMIPALMEGTRQMVIKSTIAGTLEETFDRYFYPQIGLSKASLAEKITDFYANVFPLLRPETSPRPLAVETVKKCLKRGWKVAVATNPLFPIAAVHHRLDWAGLNSGSVPFAAITSFDTYHFAKPQAAYFAETAARIEAFDHPVVMVGNDLKDDIIAGGNAGFPAFWLTDSDQPLPPGLPAGSSKGRMEDVFPWLENIERNWKPGLMDIPALLAALRGSAAAIDAITRTLPAYKWTGKVTASEWSVTEILCHLRDLDREINLSRMQTILQEHRPFIAGIETDKWSVERSYNSQNGEKALEEFISARQDIVNLLEKADQDDWARMIRHSIFGPTTLKELVSFMVAHDSNHIKQINKQIQSCA